MKINESIENLKTTLAQANDMIKLSEKSINQTLNNLMQQATPEQMAVIQNQVKTIKTLMVKAKKGENVDAEITTISKTITNGR